MQAWAWVEWKEGNLDVARELFQRAIAIDPKSMDAVRSFQVYFLQYPFTYRVFNLCFDWGSETLLGEIFTP